MKLDDIEDARTDVEHIVKIPFGDKELEVVYRPLTDTILNTRGAAQQLAAAIVRWNAEEDSSFEVLTNRPLPFLQKIMDAITLDYFPKKA